MDIFLNMESLTNARNNLNMGNPRVENLWEIWKVNAKNKLKSKKESKQIE